MSTQMRYMLKTEGLDFEVSKRPVPKTDPKGVQKMDAASGWPVFVVEVTAWRSESEGSQVLDIAVPAPRPPELTFREAVDVVDLEIIPWAQKGRDGEVRSGVAFRAKEIRPIAA